MNLISRSLRDFFRLYLEIRIRLKKSNIVYKVISTVFVFIQMSAIALLSGQPTNLMGIDMVQEPKQGFLNFLLFIPWYFDVKYTCFDSVFVLMLQIIWLTVTLNAYRRLKNRKTLRTYHLVAIVVLEQSLVNIFSIPLYFRIALNVDCILNHYQHIYIISLVICSISTLFNLFIAFVHSVFLEPFDLVERSLFDLYDGKNRLVFHIINLFNVFMSFYLPYVTSEVQKYIFYFLLLSVSIFDLYIRVLPFTYVSWLVKYCQNAINFVIPFCITARILLNLSFFFTCLVYFACLILYAVIFWVAHFFLNQKASHLLTNFATNGGIDQIFFGSFFTPFNFVSLLRKISKMNPSPEIFQSLMQMQSSINRRGSNLIEICRFLGLFPSRRNEMIAEIDRTDSNSLHNQFILYCIRERLNSLILVSSPEERLSLGRFRFQYVETMKRYWESRRDQKHFRSFIELINGYVLGLELLGEAPALLRRFPFDSSVRRLYIECLYLTGGDSMEIQNQQNILNELSETPPNITDPILHSAIRYHPHVMSYLSAEELQRCSSSTQMRSKKAPKMERPAWSYLANLRSNYIPGVVAMYSLPLIALFILSLRIVFREMDASKLSFRIDNLTTDVVFDFSFASASMFIQFSINDTFTSSNFTLSQSTNESECQIVLFDCVLHLMTYYSYLGQIRGIVTFMVPVVTTFFHNILNSTNTYCSVLQKFTEFPRNYSLYSFDSPTSALSNTWNVIEQQQELFTNRYILYEFLVVFFGLIILGVSLFSLNIYIKANRMLKHYKHYFDYLASDERYQLFMEGRGEEAWELIRTYIPVSSSDDPSNAQIPPMQLPTQNNNIQQQILPNVHTTSPILPPKVKIEPEVTQELHHSDTDGDELSDLVRIEPNDNEIDPLSAPLKRSRGYIFVFGSACIMWISILIVVIFIGIAHWTRMETLCDRSRDLMLTFSLTRTSLILQNEICKAILGESFNSSLILELSNTIEKSNHTFTSFYKNNITDHEGNVIGTLKNFVHLVAENINKYSTSFWCLTFLPQFFEFTRECTLHAYEFERGSIISVKDSNIASFIADIVLFILISLSLSIYASALSAQILSKMFPFPTSLIELSSSISKEAHNDEEDHLPDNALIVRSVSETGQIYSVSQNSSILLGKRSDTLIDIPFSEVFSREDGQVPLVSTVDKKQDKRTFMIQRTTVGRIVLSVLVDDSTRVMSGNTKESTPTTQLVGYVPIYFAERFASENSSKMPIEGCYYLFMRHNVTDQKSIERFYGNFSMMVTHFSKLRCIHMDGSIITCVLTKDLNSEEIVLIAREVISKIGDQLFCMSLRYIELTDFELVVDVEPYIQSLTPFFNDCEDSLYEQPQDTISFSRELNKKKWAKSEEYGDLEIMNMRSFWISSIKVLSN